MSALTGHWHVDIDFVRGAARHTLQLEQEGDQLRGRYRSPYAEYEATGTVSADGAVELSVPVAYQHVGARYAFRGTASGDAMSGELDLGEYWTAAWKATRAG